MAEQFINKIKLRLNQLLPGEESQFMMAPIDRKRLTWDEHIEKASRKSAVLLLLCHDADGELFIPLTERYAYDGLHSGQVSFPGGKYEESDLNYTNTALRESFEEVGIEANKLEVLGDLTRLYIPVSNYMVHPIVAFCRERDTELRKNPREVKRILRFYLSDLLNENTIHNGQITLSDNRKTQAPYFLVEGLKVWGATAMILSEFKTLLADQT